MSRTRTRGIAGSTSFGTLESKSRLTNGEFVPKLVSNQNTVATDQVIDSPGLGGGDCLGFEVRKYTPDQGFKASGTSLPFGSYDEELKMTGLDCFTNWTQNLLPHLETFSPSNTALATKLAASTNPSRPLVNAASAIWELREIPQLFARHHGADVIQSGVDSRFKFRFGIAPVLQDIGNIFNFTEAVEKRVKEIERTYSVKGLRRTQNLGNYTASFPVGIRNSSRNAGFRANLSGIKSTKEQTSGHIRWKADLPGKSRIPNGDYVRSLARRSLVGGGINAQAVWEIIPFSWLVDWFTSVGDLLTATSNIVPARIDKLVIMRDIETEIKYNPPLLTSNGGVPLQGLDITGSAHVKVRTKSRTPATVGLSAFLPVLTPGQLLTATDLLLKFKK